jgi:hypothetical protein
LALVFMETTSSSISIINTFFNIEGSFPASMVILKDQISIGMVLHILLHQINFVIFLMVFMRKIIFTIFVPDSMCSIMVIHVTLNFTRRRNTMDLIGFSKYQMTSTTMRVIAYGILIDNTDKYILIGEDTTFKCVRKFAQTMIRSFEVST